MFYIGISGFRKELLGLFYNNIKKKKLIIYEEYSYNYWHFNV